MPEVKKIDISLENQTVIVKSTSDQQTVFEAIKKSGKSVEPIS
jgi:copper chaperone CopZ